MKLAACQILRFSPRTRYDDITPKTGTRLLKIAARLAPIWITPSTKNRYPMMVEKNARYRIPSHASMVQG